MKIDEDWLVRAWKSDLSRDAPPISPGLIAAHFAQFGPGGGDGPRFTFREPARAKSTLAAISPGLIAAHFA